MKYVIVFDKPVFYEDTLTNAVDVPIGANTTTSIPLIDSDRSPIYFSNTTYQLTGKNDKGETLWTCAFDYPADVVDGKIINGDWA